jgi:hypothetical protein
VDSFASNPIKKPPDVFVKRLFPTTRRAYRLELVHRHPYRPARARLGLKRGVNLLGNFGAQEF